MAEREAALREANPGAPATIPADALTASGSGLDPHISAGVRRATRCHGWRRPAGLSDEQVQRMVAAHTQHAALGFIGEDRVNVTELNVALETAEPATGSQ